MKKTLIALAGICLAILCWKVCRCQDDGPLKEGVYADVLEIKKGPSGGEYRLKDE